MFRNLYRVFGTIRYLKLTQIIHQLKYRISQPNSLNYYEVNYKRVSTLNLTTLSPVCETWYGEFKFEFINQKADFKKKTDWNYQDYGKLWNYNLQYANYLLQTNRKDDEKELLITDLYRWISDGRLPLEPYPVSLRVINMMRWFSNRRTENHHLFSEVYAELNFLSQRLEYHLLGNHLLENAFALLMGGAFFSQASWVETGKRILLKELEEQVLSDGAHFELSPMYHQIIFFRLLELIDWYSKWAGNEPAFEKFLRGKAGNMRAWLEHISFVNGDIPHFNDSADGIAYPTRWLLTYANRLGVTKNNMPLGESGYRSVNLGDYECKVDFAQLGPSYQPGHAHADALSFVLYYQGKPLFVEQGTSTYQIGAIRERERSTAAHNTVVVANNNQSNVWGGFRVAERAKTKILLDEPHQLKAEHNGYRKYGVTHQRTFEFEKEKIIVIDDVKGNDGCLKEFHLHIYPGIDIEVAGDDSVALSNGVSIIFDAGISISIQSYDMADGYNRYKSGRKIVVPFTNRLTTTVLMNN